MMIGTPLFTAMLLEPPRPQLIPWPGRGDAWSWGRVWHLLMVRPEGPWWVTGCVAVWALPLMGAILYTFISGHLVVRFEAVYALPLCFLGALCFPVVMSELLNLFLRGFQMDSDRCDYRFAISPPACGVIVGFIYLGSYITAHLYNVNELWTTPLTILCPPILAITMPRIGEFVDYTCFAACAWPVPLLIGWHAARAECARAEHSAALIMPASVPRAGMSMAVASAMLVALVALPVIWSGSEGASFNYSGSEEKIGFSPDGAKMALPVEGDGLFGLDIWDLGTRRRQIPTISLESYPSHHEFSPDGTKVLATVYEVPIPGMWETATGRKLPLPPAMTVPSGETAWNHAAFVMDGKALVLCNTETMSIWSLADGKQTGDKIPMATVRSIVADHKSGRFVVVGESKSPRIWDAATGQPVGKPLGEIPLVTALFSRDGKAIAGIVKEQEGKALAFVWDATTGEQILALDGDDFEPETISFSPDGRFVRAANLIGVVRSWDVAAKTVTSINPTPGMVSTRTSFSADGTRMLQVLDRSGMITVRDASTGRLLFTPLQSYLRSSSSVMFTPDGSRVLRLSRVLRVWDLRLVAPRRK
ncbi:MAG TPA: WD40 repeat domain-containing protein [Candidatus Methylacidiphilales bacterium]|nr:WD40 repeat domain-containing protein [Candidatus Methylacidiphilales bacterium]